MASRPSTIKTMPMKLTSGQLFAQHDGTEQNCAWRDQDRDQHDIGRPSAGQDAEEEDVANRSR